MIFDRIENAGLYFPVSSPFSVGIDFIQNALRDNPTDGRYELDGGAYAMIQTYPTAPADGKNPESHRKYADIQALLSGRELVGWQTTKGLETKIAYNPEKDIEFYKNSAEEISLSLKPGLFGVFYPSDAHKPGCCVDTSEDVRKVVVKIPV